MDLAKALTLLKGGPAGIKEWNAYRRAGGKCPHLQDVDLAGADLAGANHESRPARSSSSTTRPTNLSPDGFNPGCATRA